MKRKTSDSNSDPSMSHTIHDQTLEAFSLY
jgi:hypothetical protein